MEQFLPPEEHLPEAYKVMPEPERTIMKQMLRKKASTYGKYDRFIVDFDLGDSTNSKGNMTVVTQEKEMFFDEVMSEMDEFGFEGQHDDQEGYIDRLALILTRKEPFYDWLNGIAPDQRLMDAPYSESKVYLLDEFIGEEGEIWIENEFDTIFEMELMASVHHETDWPKKRPYKMFREWFDFSFTSMIYDMENYPILKDGVI